ncbi:Diazepam binding inhibitor, splice form 1b,related [Neospora caninum Liverpool]|uniref:Diazepam binding inhibitor, splice form 1b,related n=1 Tax=Neospora caninum (strain Liverpool) TaxID=572307 RepID=F0VR91_NEOCL|nr:Diazepam binding inhibitor, splice form 1b,related [Neospora caninum Liverpool]CBZ56239.1 Diazepam binding inhibitor, splice form 1b,related [Neospora caninum Liverpool]CEL71001.1 TPA: Diazepam binding inhibitor, splice form 1b,related [Neospora caninum Liverpool]|eukprot:XP_003886264.1 Diazepam binding inhibitor, splice form 1b,related [Neospora caninum Liverpool]
MASQEEFERAAKYVQTSGKDSGLNPTNDQKLEFYKYYKQATVGDCNEPAPGLFAFEAKLKHGAWMSVKGMSKDEAMKKYVEALDRIQPAWREKSA